MHGAMSGMMLSPKMQRYQRSIRINDGQLLGLAEKARNDSRLSGYLYKRSSDSTKWLLRWFRLYQNLLFYYDNDSSNRPVGVIFLEGCYCERLLNPHIGKDESIEKVYCFAIMYRRENQRQYELRADTISECQAWIDGIKMASFNKLHLQMEEVEQKHLHLLQVVESEKTAKWQYTQHCDELTDEIKKLRNELFVMKKEWRLLPQISKSSSSQDGDKSDDEEDPDIAKIKKVQSFFRGWLCRRRWKQIVEEYIRSPHAESMRKRNCLVFRMVESEEEYVEQLEILISCFLRPFKMAASSKNPPCTHEDINSIFLNSETVLFLHQIFLKGLTARMESWPTLVLGTSLGDLFDMLLPMLSIYQEYVRNHHYCLQVLTECKQNQQFGSLLHRLEKKPACKGRSLETFLTYPMHQIPRYIITLHELLAHTPPDHVEKKSLEHARIQLEDLSRQMHDEVSETENIRKNLAIERMIIEGCDILLDVNQMFVRQGTLVQILPPGSKSGARGRMGIGREKEREAVRQCFLFSNHLIITTRTQAGRLHLVDSVGKIPLADVTLVEDPSEEERMDEPESPCGSSDSSSTSDMGNIVKYEHKSLDFKLIMDDVKSGNQVTIHLVAPTHQEKASWITDITQCMDTVHFNGLFYNTMPNASSSTIPQCVKSDPNLFKDDVDIRFSKTFNTCKIPQIRYATPERLLQRLTDLRFLNIDFLNTFLLTYRVFTDGITVLEALKMVFFNPDQPSSPTSSNGSMENLTHAEGSIQVNLLHPSQTLTLDGSRRISTCSGYSTATDNGRHGSLTPSRRISGASSLSGYYSDERERSSSEANHKSQHWKYTYRRYEEEQRNEEATAALPGSRHVVTRGSIALPPQSRKGSHDSTGSGRSGSIISTSQWRKESVTIVEQVEPITEQDDDATDRIEYGDTGRQNSLGMAPMPAAAGKAFSLGNDKDGEFLSVPKKTITASSSAETLTDNTLTAPSSPNQASNKRKGSVGANLMVRSSPSVDESELGGLDEVEDKKLLLAKTESSHELPLKSALKKCSISSIGSTHSPKSRARSTSTFSSASYTYNMNNEDDGSDVITARGCSSQPGSHHPSFSSPTGSRIVFGGLNLKDLTIGMKSPTKDTKKRKGIFNRHVGSSGNDTSNDHSSSPISSPQHSKMGVVVTSSRQAHRSDHNDSHSSKRASKDAVSLEYFLSELSDEDSNSWSSSANAAVAFAVATAGSGNPPDPTHKDAFKEAAKRKMSLTSSVSTMRVLSVLRHWVTKHTQDFESNVQLKNLTIEFLEDIICTPTLLPSEHRASSQLLRMLTKDEPSTSKFNLDEILTPTQVPSRENINTLSALEIAEQMTFLDQKILFTIQSSEFLGQAWTKPDKDVKSPHIVIMTKRFNDMSCLVISDIVTEPDVATRVQVIEKWTAVADICRCLHNFNGVLQICAAFTNSSVFRLKNTWNRVSKSTKQTIEKLQALVSSDGRFRNLRDSLHRTDPPCIPYLGMYLSDLTFIEEGTPNFTDNRLLNFAKMRMIAHVIREIRQFQQTPYKIDQVPKVTNYILDPERQLDDEMLYQQSLIVEPRTSRLSSSFGHSVAAAAIAAAAAKEQQ
ncbi:ras-specific guanine nucleotide-releasing factor 2-like isoform X2 [Tigriopus californicus]|uniref:ras-specific guanine nucleotide-releasing factor 2-like isoform X2 n=1 Tax=Tigriopus californicus TaxID=6832 RepID=UPI0027D9CEC6|nr:ras-specific guanine nucleotide-releasing factor 2-like isoform X2 [Tigriopus californicus]